MRRSGSRWSSGWSGAGFASPAAAQGAETFSVKGLRTEKVTLYDCNKEGTSAGR